MAMFLAAGAVVLALRRMPPETRRVAPLVVVALALALALPDAGRLARGSPAAGPLGYGNANAALYLQAALAAALVALTWPRPAVRVACGAVAVLFAVVTIQSSRAGGVLVAVAVVGLLASGGRWRTRILVALLVGGFVAALALPIVVGERYADGRTGGFVAQAARAFDRRRVALWSEALALAEANPVVGVGPGSFSEESATAATDPDAAWAHDDFLQAAAEGGVPAAAILVAVFLWGLALAWSSGGAQGAPVGAVAVAVLGIHASVDHLLGYPLIPLSAAAVLGSAGPTGRTGEIRPTPAVRKLIKVAVLPMGLAARRREGDLAVLLYHRVGAGDREVDLDEAAFAAQMEMLAGQVRSLDEVTGDAERGGVVVTFDDGYADFHEVVLPLLVEHRVPATLYLATGLVREEGADQPEALSWPQLREAVETGLVTVGSHTHGHADLSRAGAAQAEEEMRRSKELVEERLQRPCRHFAFPFAVGSPEARSTARHLFDTAALGWRTNRAGRIDPYRLGRTPVLRSDGRFFFRAKLDGMLDREALVYRAFRRGPWRYS
jgi:peptidoglycan/xylan/chitin deacetylase (PgdA/CDA1 family)